MSRKNKLKKYMRKSDSYNRSFFHLALLWHAHSIFEDDNPDLTTNYFAIQEYRMDQTCFWRRKYIEYKGKLK